MTRPSTGGAGLWVVTALIVLLRVGAQSTAATTASPVAPPPPSPTYATEVAVVATLASFTDATAFARRWKNSTLVRIANAAENAEVKAALTEAGVVRGWIGGAQTPGVTNAPFVWSDGVAVGSVARPYTNWATGRPLAGQANTAIAVDAFTGLWFDIQQGSQQSSAVRIPSREVTQTLPLPDYTFPKGIPSPAVTPPWQTAVVITCSLLILPLLAGTVALAAWHWRTPIRIDNKHGYAAVEPAVTSLEQQKPPPPLKEGGGGGDDCVLPLPDILKRLPPAMVAATQQQLGKPLNLTDIAVVVVEESPKASSLSGDAQAPVASDAGVNVPAEDKITPLAGIETATPTTTGDSHADGPTVPAAPEAQGEKSTAAPVPQPEAPPPAVAAVPQVPPPVAVPARKLPAATPLATPPPAVRQLPPATATGPPAPAPRKLPPATAAGAGPGPRTLSPATVLGAAKAPVATLAGPKAPPPGARATLPAAGGAVKKGMPMAGNGPKAPPPAAAAAKAKAPSAAALPTAKGARTLPPARRV